jgi:hypothetical protein
MALDTSGLSKDLVSLFKEMRTREVEEDADIEFANRLSAILEKFVKTGEVIVAPGIRTSGGQSTISTGTGIIK